MSNEPVSIPPAGEDKTVAILSYITIFGFIVAIILNSSKKTALGAFHLRQVLGLIIAGMAVWIALVILLIILTLILGAIGLASIGLALSSIVYGVVGLGFLVITIMGFVSAVQGTMKPIPIIGAKIQSVLKNVFN